MVINPLNTELNPICCLLALLGAHDFLHVSRIGVKSLTLRLLMSYIYMTLVGLNNGWGMEEMYNFCLKTWRLRWSMDILKWLLE
jgi:hypothetical protein